MKGNASTLLNIINSTQEVGGVFLVHLDWNSQYFITNHDSDITWNGNVYTGGGQLLGVQPPNYSTVVDREIYTIELDALDAQMKAEIATGVTYKPVTVRLGFTLDGVFQDGLDETLYAYKGNVGTVKHNVNNEDSVYVVECTAPLSDLDAKSPRFTTTNQQQLHYPTDTCFEGIHEGSEAIILEWGKI